MSEVTQTLGFDASSALASLASLNGSLAAFQASLDRSAASLRNFNTAGSSASTLLARLSTRATAAATSLSTLNGAGLAGVTSSLTTLGAASATTSAKVAANSASMAASIRSSSAASSASLGQLTTSMNLLSRIIFTQLAIRGLSQLRRGIEDTGKSAVDFQRQIALIQTIDQSGQSFDQLAASVRSVSDQFNIPLLQSAAGLYQTISNQVGDAAQSLQFYNEAARFARSTNSTLADSVDLLSGALKSYGLGVEDTNKVSATFFKAIDLGRLTSSEMANAMGRILPISAQLGVSLDETAGALAAISIKGSDAAESITQQRSVLTALLKPSVAMKGALNDLGFSTAEVGVQTLGLTGLLRAIADQTGGSSTAMATLFRNVRGLSGATSLTADNLKTMADNIDEMTASGRNFNNEKFLQATATDAEKVTAEINKLKNALTVELGQSILKTGTSFAEFVGGADNVAETVKVLGPAIVGLTGGVIALRGAMVAADAGALGLAGSFRVLGAALVAAGLTKSAVDVLENFRSANNLAPLKSLEKSNQEGLDKYKAQLSEARDADNKASQDRLKTALQSTRGLNKEYLQQQADLKAAQKAVDKLSAKAPKASQIADAQKQIDTLGNIPRNVRPTDDQTAQLAAAKTQLQELTAQTNQLAAAKAKLNQLQSQSSNPLAGVQGVGQLESLLGTKITTPDQLSRGLIDAEKHAEELRAKLQTALSVKPQADNLKAELDSVFQQIAQKADVRNSVNSFNAPALNSQFDNTVQLFKAVNSDGKVTEDELRTVLKLALQLRDNVTDGGASLGNVFLQKAGFTSSLELMDQALQKMQQLQRLPTASIGPLQTELQQFDSVLSRFASNLSAGVGTSAAIANNFERGAAAAAKMVVPAGGQAPVQSRAEGGLIYLAAGGFAPKGTDTVPAMLSPGEFVVNAAATRQFYSQLVAINSGRAPVYRAEGGPVNVQFGDISIVESAHGKNTARDFVDGVRRELRRSTSIL